MKNSLATCIFAVAAISSITSETVFAQMSSSNCTALVKIKNDLWFVSAAGLPISRITNDEELKTAASLSVDGKLIAYSGVSNNNNVTILSDNGRSLATVDVGAQDAITGLSWVAPDIIRIQEHVGPTSSSYRFLKVPLNSPSTASILPGHPGLGSSCAISPKHNKMSCTQADALIINNRPVYYTPDPFQSAIELQVITLATGATITTTTEPQFGLTVGKINDRRVSLKITQPDGSWQQSEVTFGETLPVIVAPTGSSEKVAVFGFQPLKNRSERGKEDSTISISIKKSTSGETVFESGPVWSTDGNRLAFVESNSSGQRTLVLFRREMGDADEAESGVIQKTVLPIQGPIRSVAFISEGKVSVEGQTQVYQGTPPPLGLKNGQWTYTLTPALPTTITVANGTKKFVAEVVGWSCQ